MAATGVSIEDLVVLVVRRELRVFFSDILKLLRSPLDNPIEVPITNDQTSSYQLVDDTVNDDNILPSVERSQSSISDVGQNSRTSFLNRMRRCGHTEKAGLVFGNFLERVHGGDEAKLNDAVEFWGKAFDDVNVGRMLERLIGGRLLR